MILEFLNQTMKKLNLVLGGDRPAASSAQINEEKNYAFVEFATPREATNAMSLGTLYLSPLLTVLTM